MNKSARAELLSQRCALQGGTAVVHRPDLCFPCKTRQQQEATERRKKLETRCIARDPIKTRRSRLSPGVAVSSDKKDSKWKNTT